MYIGDFVQRNLLSEKIEIRKMSKLQNWYLGKDEWSDKFLILLAFLFCGYHLSMYLDNSSWLWSRLLSFPFDLVYYPFIFMISVHLIEITIMSFLDAFQYPT
jgi:hypothetical protein